MQSIPITLIKKVRPIFCVYRHHEYCNLKCKATWGKRALILLKQLVDDLRPLLLFVCEFKVNGKVARTWLAELHFDSVFAIDARGSNGGLLLFWSNKINVSLCSYSVNHIDVNVCWESVNWRFTRCYAPSVSEERVALWELLCKLYNLRIDESERWLLGGILMMSYFSQKRNEEHVKKL